MKPEKLARYIDHTCLNMETTSEKIVEVCREAMDWNVASVCIPPSYVEHASSLLRESPVHVGTVIGFPFGYASTAVKVLEAENSRSDGADEIDIVIHLGKLKAGEYSYVEKELKSVIQAAPGLIHKVIIESAALTDQEKKTAARLVWDAGAEYVKTSTGFGPGGATLEDVRLLSEVSKGDLKVKASGGIRNLKTTLAMIEAGAHRIGTSSAREILSECKTGLSGPIRKLSTEDDNGKNT